MKTFERALAEAKALAEVEAAAAAADEAAWKEAEQAAAAWADERAADRAALLDELAEDEDEAFPDLDAAVGGGGDADDFAEDEDEGEGEADEEDHVHVPMFNVHDMMQAADSDEEEEKEDSGDELYLPETWGKAYNAGAYHDGETTVTISFAAEDGALDAVDAAEPYIFAAEDGHPDALDHDAGVEDEDYLNGLDLFEMDDADGYISDDDFDQVQEGDFLISNLTQIHHIRHYPNKYSRVSHFIVFSFPFGDALQLLDGIKKAREDGCLQCVGNIRRLLQASHLNRTLVRLHSTLYRVGRDLQEQMMKERDLGSTLREFLQELSLDRAHLQPPNVLRCLDVIATALRALLAAAAHGRIAGPLDYTELNHCVQYILKRIKSLDQEQVNYPRDADPFEAFPLDDEQPAAVNGIDQEAEDESDYDDTEDDMACYDISLQPEEEIDPDAPPWVSDSDASDDIMGYVLIRGLENLQYIRKSPNKYCHSFNYILVSFAFADTPQLLHEVREASEEFSWTWVGNMERLRQAHSISRTLGLVHRALDRLGSYIQDNRMDRALVSSLAGFLPCLDFTRTDLQPDDIRYFVDNIALSIQDLLNAVPSVNPAVRDSEPPCSIDFPDLCARLQFIMERMDSLDNQHVRYNKDVERPEVLPPLPGPAPLPFPSP